jgi:Protein of unknown function (DUF4236)
MSNQGDGRPESPRPAPGVARYAATMDYIRLWRRKTIAPGVRLNLSKSGLGWSLGPRGTTDYLGL